MIGGLLDYLSERHPGSQLIGFKDGPGGILKKSRMDITEDIMASALQTSTSILTRHAYILDTPCTCSAAHAKDSC